MNGKGHLRIDLFPQLRSISSLALIQNNYRIVKSSPLGKGFDFDCIDISSLTDVITRIKRNGLKGVDSQIDIAILPSDLNLDSSFHHELNLSSIDPPSNRMQTIHGIVEIQNQNLYGSESNIDCLYKGGNVRLIGIPQSRNP